MQSAENGVAQFCLAEHKDPWIDFKCEHWGPSKFRLRIGRSVTGLIDQSDLCPRCMNARLSTEAAAPRE